MSDRKFKTRIFRSRRPYRYYESTTTAITDNVEDNGKSSTGENLDSSKNKNLEDNNCVPLELAKEDEVSPRAIQNGETIGNTAIASIDIQTMDRESALSEISAQTIEMEGKLPVENGVVTVQDNDRMEHAKTVLSNQSEKQAIDGDTDSTSDDDNIHLKYIDEMLYKLLENEEIVATANVEENKRIIENAAHKLINFPTVKIDSNLLDYIDKVLTELFAYIEINDNIHKEKTFLTSEDSKMVNNNAHLECVKHELLNVSENLQIDDNPGLRVMEDNNKIHLECIENVLCDSPGIQEAVANDPDVVTQNVSLTSTEYLRPSDQPINNCFMNLNCNTSGAPFVAPPERDYLPILEPSSTFSHKDVVPVFQPFCPTRVHPIGFNYETVVPVFRTNILANREGSKVFQQFSKPEIVQWRGILPEMKFTRNSNLSKQIYLEGIPSDMSEPDLINKLEEGGPVTLRWPYSENANYHFRGYAHATFYFEWSLGTLLNSCICESGKWYMEIPQRGRMINIQIIPLDLDDLCFRKTRTTTVDLVKTVFVSGMRGVFSASDIGKIFAESFGEVVYASIRTDHQGGSAIGSGRVCFAHLQSCIDAIVAGGIEIYSNRINRTILIQPYLYESNCSECKGGPCIRFCKNFGCMKYYCSICSFHHFSVYPQHCYLLLKGRLGPPDQIYVP